MITPDLWVYQWVHQNAENRPFDDLELWSVIEAWSLLPDAVKSGIVAMVNATQRVNSPDKDSIQRRGAALGGLVDRLPQESAA